MRIQEVVDIIENVKKEGRTLMLEHEARKVMELCGVPTPKWAFATSADDAVEKAEGLYPLAMKIASLDIIHKTDVGGVALNIKKAEELRVKYNSKINNIAKKAPNAKLLGVNIIQMQKGIECIIGMSKDPQFGSVVMFGLGGVFVELMKDVSFRVVPFGEIEAERLVNSIKGQKVLNGFRGMKAHKESIIKTLCAVQKLAPLVEEIDINPLISNDEGSYAVDARIVV
jgi:acyl-CoA synthetase (NDP forming)